MNAVQPSDNNSEAAFIEIVKLQKMVATLTTRWYELTGFNLDELLFLACSFRGGHLTQRELLGYYRGQAIDLTPLVKKFQDAGWLQATESPATSANLEYWLTATGRARVAALITELKKTLSLFNADNFFDELAAFKRTTVQGDA